MEQSKHLTVSVSSQTLSLKPMRIPIHLKKVCKEKKWCRYNINLGTVHLYTVCNVYDASTTPKCGTRTIKKMRGHNTDRLACGVTS